MIENYLNIPADKLLEAAGQTIYMLGISLFFGTLIGIPVSYTHLDVYKRQLLC